VQAGGGERDDVPPPLVRVRPALVQLALLEQVNIVPDDARGLCTCSQHAAEWVARASPGE
jgi:hypothetical protein